MPKAPTKPRSKAVKTDPQDAFRKLVRDAMKAQDHSIADTARGAQISDVGEDGRLTLSRWLGGSRGMSTEKLAKVLCYLGVKIGPYSNKAAKA